MSFTVEEINLICVALGDTKDDTINNLFEMISDMNDADMVSLAERVVGKLDGITEQEFTEKNFKEDFSEE
jgi:F420-0:gamma-glutamyl ligase